MGKKQIVKYRVIPERLMKDLVEFIDEIQFEASETNTVENHHILNLCTYLISCLINSDSFTDEFGQNEPEEDDTDYDGMDIPPEAYDWDSSSTSNDLCLSPDIVKIPSSTSTFNCFLSSPGISAITPTLSSYS